MTQAPDRGRHPRGCRPRRRFLTVRSGRSCLRVAAGCPKWPAVFQSGRRFSTCGESRPRVVHVQVENLHPREGKRAACLPTWTQVPESGRWLPEVAAGFQPAVSPSPGWFMCRLKTCTHARATTRMPAEVAAGCPKWPQVFNLRNQPCADSRPARGRPCGRCGPPPPSRPPRFNPEWSYHIGQESATDGLQPGRKKGAHLFSRSSWKKRSAKQGSNPPRVDDGSLCKRPGRRITRIAKHRGIAGQGF